MLTDTKNPSKIPRCLQTENVTEIRAPVPSVYVNIKPCCVLMEMRITDPNFVKYFLKLFDVMDRVYRQTLDRHMTAIQTTLNIMFHDHARPLLVLLLHGYS